jgi:hypothetical protein
MGYQNLIWLFGGIVVALIVIGIGTRVLGDNT